MKLNHLKSIILITGVSMLLFACYKEPKFSSKPNISFYSISKEIRLDQFSGAKKDSIIVAINFQDEEGDLGYNVDEIGTLVAKTNYNYLVTPYRKINGVFNEFKPLDTFSGFFPRLRNDGKTGPIEGKLNYRIEIQSAFWPAKKDTVKFGISIVDRAGNISNSVETTPIVVNQY